MATIILSTSFKLSGTFVTGLSPTLDAYTTDGTQIITAQGATEINALGAYFYSFTTWDGSDFYFRFDAGTDSVDDRYPDGWALAANDTVAVSGDLTAADNIEANISNLDAAISTRSSHTAADVWAVATRTLTSFGTLITDIWASVTRTITGGTIDTNNDKTGYSISGTKTTLDALNDLSSAQVNTEADTALSDIRLHELIASALTGQPISGSLLGDLTEDDGGTQRFSANALEQAPSGGLTPGQEAKIDLAIKILRNRLKHNTDGTVTLYDDDKTSVLATFNIYNKNGELIPLANFGNVTPAERGAWE